MSRVRFTAVAIAAVIAAGPLTALPASARQHGNVAIVLKPKGQDAEVVREGYFLYSLFKGLKNRAKVDQRGSGNGAAVAQHGTNNTAEVFQRGSGHSGTISQSGSNNLFGLFQFGRNTKANVSQTGNGQTGIEIDAGW